MARVTIHSRGVVEVLRSAGVDIAVRALAERAGAAARSQGHRVTSGELLPVEVFRDPGSDRAGATVAIRHPAGVGMQAHHGVLSKATHAAGLVPEGLET